MIPTLVLMLLSLFPRSSAQAAPSPGTILRVAAASDLQFVMPELEKAFVKAHPEISLKIAYGASGSITSQIEQGAPFDVFLSADSDYPQDIVRHRLAPSAFEYAQGSLVLWIPSSSAIDLNKIGMQALADPSIRKIAIANPEHAPYGRAAVAALKSEKLYKSAKKRLVVGENIAQAAQYLETRVADAGFIAQGLAQSKAMSAQGRFIAVPAQDYPPIHQSGIVLSKSASPKEATLFQEFLLGPEARAIFGRFGYK
jgi:molybdate transport system substrate-binding protein